MCETFFLSPIRVKLPLTPSLRRRTLFLSSPLKAFVVYLFLSLTFSLIPLKTFGQSSDSDSQSIQAQTPDVTIFIKPTSADTAGVFLAYRQRVPHEQVKKEIALLAVNGWVISNIGIEDRSIRPGAPVMTGAHLSLAKAPQVINNAPALLAYLQAFQDWNQVVVLFDQSELKPYNGIERFDSPALSINRVSEENLYHYEAIIRDHKGQLPNLPTVLSTETHSEASGAAAAGSSKNTTVPLLPLMLILLGAGLLGGLGVYTLMTRRHSESSSARNARL